VKLIKRREERKKIDFKNLMDAMCFLRRNEFKDIFILIFILFTLQEPKVEEENIIMKSITILAMLHFFEIQYVG